ncbi:MAG TPA: hypothetical protein VNT32_08965 [Thermoleophilaceae bacterium]|nr:hypothetical protein [Thermoleophilaceae bacterium]
MKARMLIATALVAGLMTSLTAEASARHVAAPQITKVSPLEATIGRSIYIRGRDLNRGRRRPTVIFQRADGRAVFQRATRASRTKLTVRVPGRLQRLLATGEGGATQATLFTLRVVASRASKTTKPALSPRIGLAATGALPGTDDVLADCDSDGVNDRDDADDDNDYLDDTVENALRMNPCGVDSDGDGLEDGWEYWSARDLNRRAAPYPAKRPYANPLDPSDANIDFDGDTLSAAEEHRAWRITGRILDHGRSFSPLGYSDGTQASDPHTPPAQPAFRSAEYGIAFTPPSYPAVLDHDGDGQWQDEERDADADGLSNYDETHGRLMEGWWRAVLGELNVDPWPETYYGAFSEHPFGSVAMDDPDSDGDGLLDAEDDQDHDDWANITEAEGWPYGAPQIQMGSPPGYSNAFNPCAPTDSRTCPRYEPVG